ncbi:MAG: hypothetical protein U5N56_09900 [Candidatus Marinimicrobia bacterium]|nr:hypothetical protein [Candidatus Neomarinimicrobiota bacterium]
MNQNTEYDSCISITGLLNYSYSAYKIVPRLAFDIVEGVRTGETKVYTRIQRMQQVRYSDLLKTSQDAVSDISYLDKEDTTLHVKGIITMPTGLSYAGDGVKFIMTDAHGGPWSAVLSYNADASLYPDLFAGDSIEMSGYVGEYTTGPSNMTEFWLVGDVNLLGTTELPDTAVINTGDLRLPATAEQWGNSTVRIENALITDNDVQYSIFEMDDGTGSCLVQADSDSLDNYVTPPIMTPIESLTGWVYHHYGSYADSTTYNINPLYEEDIVLGEGPPCCWNQKEVRNISRIRLRMSLLPFLFPPCVTLILPRFSTASITANFPTSICRTSAIISGRARYRTVRTAPSSNTIIM